MKIMTTVTIKFFATFRELTGKREEKMQIDQERTTIAYILDKLSDEYGKNFKDYVFEPSKRKSLKSQISIMVNGTSIRNLERLKTNVNDGDTVAILPPISGG